MTGLGWGLGEFRVYIGGRWSLDMKVQTCPTANKHGFPAFVPWNMLHASDVGRQPQGVDLEAIFALEAGCDLTSKWPVPNSESHYSALLSF